MSKFISVLLVTTLYVETTLQHQKFSPRHSATLGFSSESKCRENFNYKHPHPCTPGKDCFFVVKWQPLEELEEEEKAGEKQKWVEFEVTADLTGLNLAASFWVALGFSSNSAMGDSDVIGCLQHADGSSDVLDGYNLADDHKFLPDRERGESSPHQLQVVLNATKLQGEMFTCNFHRLVDTGDVIQDRMLREHQFVLAAVGSLKESSNGNKSRMLKHLRYAASSCACDVLSCNQACSCPVGFFYQMLKLHGIVMSISFMLLIPTGSIVSRYYKAVFNNAWFKAHVTLMMIGVLWSLLGLALVLIHTRGVFSVGVHQILGILVLALAVVQPMVGFLRPLNQPTKLRKVFNYFHRSLASSILVLSVVVMFLGVYLFHNMVYQFMLSVLSLFVLFNIVFLVFLEILKRCHKFSSSPPVGYHKVTPPKDETESEAEDDVYVKDEALKSMKHVYSIEKGLLLLFVVVNLVFSGIISIFIFYYDANSD